MSCQDLKTAILANKHLYHFLSPQYTHLARERRLPLKDIDSKVKIIEHIMEMMSNAGIVMNVDFWMFGQNRMNVYRIKDLLQIDTLQVYLRKVNLRKKHTILNTERSLPDKMEPISLKPNEVQRQYWERQQNGNRTQVRSMLWILRWVCRVHKVRMSMQRVRALQMRKYACVIGVSYMYVYICLPTQVLNTCIIQCLFCHPKS